MTDASQLTFFEHRFHGDEPPRQSDVRTAYERDRARIIHSAGFRRLQGKTQVMGVGEGDFHRTRLTHSIECAQIGAGIIDQVERSGAIPEELRPWLPPRPLMEAACFAHDLGHPPFGHGGEQALFLAMRMHGGFEGNAHTLRLLTRLEKYKSPGFGVNPTRRLILSVLKYPLPYSSFEYTNEKKYPWKPPKCYFDEESEIVEWALEGFPVDDRRYFTTADADGRAAHRIFDCSAMELADDIAYGIHDIEDIVARRLSDREHVRAALDDAFASVGGQLDTNDGHIGAEQICSDLFGDSYQRKQMIARLVNVFISAARINADSRFKHPLLNFRVALPMRHSVLLDKLKKMSFQLVILKAPVQQLERRGMRVVADIFRELASNPKQLIPSWDDRYVARDVKRHVCDYVAGMTDNYAERVYRRLFVPGVGSSSDEL